MTPLQVLRAHFEAQKRRRYEVPAITADGLALVVYHDPVTLLDLVELEMHRAKGVHEFYLQVVLLKALNKDGTRAFGLEEGYILKRLVDGPTLMRMAEAMLDTGPSAASLGERSGGRNAQPSAPPSTSPPPPAASPETPSPTPPPYGRDGLPPVL